MDKISFPYRASSHLVLLHVINDCGAWARQNLEVNYNYQSSSKDAHKMVLRLAREEGLLVGVSSGANLVAAMNAAAKLKEGVVVTIFCDSAAKYLSESFWQGTGEAEIWP